VGLSYTLGVDGIGLNCVVLVWYEWILLENNVIWGI